MASPSGPMRRPRPRQPGRLLRRPGRADFLTGFSVANSVANPMDLTALNGRVTNTWKVKIWR
jgi:hypothetical protein